MSHLRDGELRMIKKFQL